MARISRVARAKTSADGCRAIQSESCRSAGLPSAMPRSRANVMSSVRSAGVMPPSAQAISTMGTSGRTLIVSGVNPSALELLEERRVAQAGLRAQLALRAVGRRRGAHLLDELAIFLAEIVVFRGAPAIVQKITFRHHTSCSLRRS